MVAVGKSEREVGRELAQYLRLRLEKKGVAVADCHNLYYSLSINSEGRVTTDKDENDESPTPRDIRRGGLSAFQVDVAVYEPGDAGHFEVPRVVLELKTRGVHTHDLILYSAKAGRHKEVYPYLRYGLVVLGEKAKIHPKVLRHGTQFDFVCVLSQPSLDDETCSRLADIVAQELESSKKLSHYLKRGLPADQRPLVMRRELLFEFWGERQGGTLALGGEAPPQAV